MEGYPRRGGGSWGSLARGKIEERKNLNISRMWGTTFDCDLNCDRQTETPATAMLTPTGNGI